MLRGISTAGITDDTNVEELPGVFRVTGTETYRTAIGGTSTVLVAEMVDLAPLDPLRRKADEAWRAQVREAEERGRKLQADVGHLAELVRSAAAANARVQAQLRAEQSADVKLTLAKALLRDGKQDKARERLTQIVKDFPGTKAADEAENLLRNLK
jgi:TolA-binding protein